MFTIILGENRFSCRQKLDQLLDSKQATEIDASEQDTVEKIASAIQGGSLFSKEDTVVIRHLNEGTLDADKLVEIFKKVPDSTHLIVYLPGVKSADKNIKRFLKLADEVVEEKNLNQAETLRWVKDRAKQLGGEIGDSQARRLVDFVGSDQQNLDNEITKLVSFNKKITKDTIEQVAVPAVQTTIFQMLDAMIGGRAEQAVKLFKNLLLERLDPGYIITMVCWQASVMTAAVAGKQNMSDLASKTGLSPFVLKKASQATKNITRSEMVKLNQEIIKTDIVLKSESVDAIRTVEQLIRKVALKTF